MLEIVVALVALTFVVAAWDVARRWVAAYRFNLTYWNRLRVLEEQATMQGEAIDHLKNRLTAQAATMSTRVPRIGQR